MNRRTTSFAALTALAAAVALLVAPRALVERSAAVFTATARATSNVVTAGTTGCTTAAWTSLVTSTSTVPTTDRAVYNRLDGTPGTDAWMSSSGWTSSEMTGSVPGALYCDPDTAITATTTTASASSASVAQSTFFSTGSTDGSTALLWFRLPATTTPGRLVSVASTSASDRVVWVDADGHVRLSARPGQPASSWTTAAGGPAVDDGVWHLVVAVMGSTASGAGGVSLYLDGRLVAATGTGTAYEFRDGPSTANGFSGSSVRWVLGSSTASTYPTGAPTGGAPSASYDEFVQWHGTVPTAAQLGTGPGSFYAAGGQ